MSILSCRIWRSQFVTSQFSDVTGQVNDIWGTKTLASIFYDPTILRLCFLLFCLYETDWAAGFVRRTLHL